MSERRRKICQFHLAKIFYNKDFYILLQQTYHESEKYIQIEGRSYIRE